MNRTLWTLLCAALALACSSRPPEVRAASPSGTANAISDAAASTAKPPSPGAVLMIASELRGYLAPCGCTENMRGGIARAAFQLEEAATGGRPVLFIDAGNSLFGVETLPEVKIPQEERKARAMAESFRLMGLDARAVGVLDDARGAAFRESLGLPDLLPGRWRLLDAGGRGVGVVAARTEEELVRGAKAARESGAVFVVGLYQQPLKAAQQAARNEALQANLIVISDPTSELNAEESKLIRSKIPVLQIQNKGRSLARVDLTFGGQGEFELARSQAQHDREIEATGERMAILKRQINDPRMSPEARQLRQAKLEELIARKHALESEPPPTPEGKNAFGINLIALEATLPDLPSVKAVMARYDKDVGLLNLAWAKQHGQDCPQPAPNEAGFVGNDGCRTCHAPAFKVYEETKHAHAYATLVEGHKQFHLDCVTCHVTGWDQPGGVCRIDKVKGREGVGCESCHGPGSLHAKVPTKATIVRRPEEQACIGCHNAENSPHFEYAAYLTKILGPGHGAPPTP